LAFAVENIEEFVVFLKSQKVAVEEIRLDEITGQRFTFFKEPDNLPLEIYETRSSSSIIYTNFILQTPSPDKWRFAKSCRH